MKINEIVQKILLIAVLLIVISCKKKEVPTHVKVIDVDQLEVNNLFSFKRPIDNCRFVALETTDESLIGKIKKVRVEKDLIFILDNTENIFVFDMSGKYLNKIGKKGQGNEELITLVDFYINKDQKYIGILDVMRQKIVRFTYEGKYISSLSYSKKMEYGINLLGMKGSDLLVGTSNCDENDYVYLIVNESDYTFKGEYLPFGIKGKMSCSYSENSSSSSKNGIYATTLFSDFVFKFSENNIPKPILMIKSKQKTADETVLSYINDMNLESAFEGLSMLKKSGFSTGINMIYATDDFLYIDFPMPNYQSCDIFYHQESGRVYKSTTYCDDFFGQGYGAALTTTSTEIVHEIDAERIIELRKQQGLFKDLKILESIKNVQQYDNPVLVFFSSGYKSKN